MASKPTATAHLNKRKNRPDEEGGSSAPIKLARTEEKAAAASAAASTTAPPSQQQQQQQQQKSIKQQHQQKVKLKALVGTPYAVQWPSAASAEHQAYIADVLTEQFSDTGRRRRQIELEARLGRHKLSKAVNAAVRQRQRQEAEKGTSTGISSRKEELEKALKLAKESAPRTAPELKGVVTGINAVTRALEQGKLRLVVVCRDVQPPTLVQHLPVLCTRSDALLVPLSQGSTFLAPLLGMKRVAAFGILKDVAEFDGLYSKLFEVVKPAKMPWAGTLTAATAKDSNQPKLQPLHYRVLDTSRAAKPDRAQREVNKIKKIKKEKKEKQATEK